MGASTSIRKRLIVSLLTLITITFLLTISKNYIDTRNQIQVLFDAQLSQSAHVLLALSTHELYEELAFIEQEGATGNEEVAALIHTHIHQYEQEIDFQIWTMDGRLAVRSENMPKLLMSNENNIFIDRVSAGEHWRIFSINNEDRTIQVQVAQRQFARNELVNDISISLISLLALVLSVLAILIYVTVGNAFKPLNKIADEIANRQSENLEPINMVDAPIESHAMISALNALFSRLSKAIENITLFTANAAHEIRTPLAAQKIHAQIAMQSTSEESRNEALNEIVHSVETATSMVDQLLTLSRLDPHGELGKDDCVDISSLTELVLVDLAPNTIEKDIELSLDATGKSKIRGREGLINILVRNLVENAILHTPKGGKIEVNVHESGDKMIFSVSDSGPGIPPEERDYVFERFYRTPENEQTGTGLGLSMVKRIIEIHSAQIRLKESELGGLLVEIEFEITNGNTDCSR